MFVVILTYVKSLEAVDALLAAHREFLDKYYQAGIFLCSGARNPRQVNSAFKGLPSERGFF